MNKREDKLREVKAPDDPFWEKRIFLAGSIEMGKAKQWQKEVFSALTGIPELLILNPRRDDWDASWEQSLQNRKFVEQVEWELEMMEGADFILMYFSPETKSPVTLLELGLFARSGKLWVCCPPGFWRKGNVDIVCRRYKVPTFETLEQLVNYLKEATW